jgi:hypothetical protein
MSLCSAPEKLRVFHFPLLASRLYGAVQQQKKISLLRTLRVSSEAGGECPILSA